MELLPPATWPVGVQVGARGRKEGAGWGQRALRGCRWLIAVAVDAKWLPNSLCADLDQRLVLVLFGETLIGLTAPIVGWVVQVAVGTGRSKRVVLSTNLCCSPHLTQMCFCQ